MPDRFWVGGTADWVNVTGSLWATSSGGTPGVATPTTSDDVYFDGNSGAITCSVVGTSNIVNCRSLYFSSSAAGFFTGMFRVSQSVTITVATTLLTASVLLSPSASYIGSLATLQMVGSTAGTHPMNSKGVTWPARLNLSRNGTYNITESNWTNGGLVNIGVTNNTTTINGNNLVCSGGIDLVIASTLGTSKFVFAGGVVGNTGSTTNAGTFGNDIDFAGNLVLGTCGFQTIAAGTTLRHVGGTITTPISRSNGAPSTHSFSGTSGFMKIDVGNNIVFVNPSIAVTGGAPLILERDMYTTGSVVIGGGSNSTILSGSNQLFVSGNLTFSAASFGITTATNSTINIIGPGTFTHNGIGNSVNLVFNTAANVFTISPSANFARIGGTMTYTSGQITTAGTTLALSTAGSTFNTDGMSWANITSAGTLTHTLNSRLNISGSLTLTGTTTFTGSSGWTNLGLVCNTAGTTINLAAGQTYITSQTASLLGTFANPIIFKSTVAGLPRAIWTLNQGATQDVTFTNGQWVDSSQGQTIYSFKGVLTDTVNWSSGSQLPTSAYISIT